MNLPVTALWYAKSCLAICQKDHLWSHTLTEPRVWLWVNSLRMLSASFHNLNLPQQALDAAYEAAQFTMKHADSRVSKQAAPHLARDILNAYTIMPRFAISDAEAVADHYLDIMAVGSSSRHVLKGLATLLQRSLIEVYIKHGSKRSLKKAQLQLENSFYLGNNGNLGALCSTLHLRTRATLSRVLGDQYAFERSIHQAHQLSETAGLLHQQKEIIGEIRQYAQ